MMYRPNVRTAVFLLVVVCGHAVAGQEQKILDFLKVGEKAPEVEFQPLSGDQKVKLSSLVEKGPVVLVVLRGWPGYQCPICTRQVGEIVAHAQEFQRAGATVVLVYPGPADGLAEHAQEFLKGAALPKPLVMMIDPDYRFTNRFQLRWDEPQETAYPSTFVLDHDRKVTFRKTSFSHGDRADTEKVVAAVEAIAGSN